MIYAHCFPSALLSHPFENRWITCAFHDIDGTHSLLRQWPPVMSIVLDRVIHNGLPDDFDSPENCRRLIKATGKEPHPETDRFCVQSAGLSALTQMEWAIRRAVEEGTVHVACDAALNTRKIQLIWKGQELFDDMPDSPEMETMLREKTPRLFRCYETVLNGYCRDKNLEAAKRDPERFRVKGSMEFLHFLRENGVKNYFVTGAVVERGMGMFEEVQTLGYPLGKGKLVEDIIGSSWDEKLPKNVIMGRLRETLGLRGEQILVVGDGRAEITAGVEMGALTLSRLPEEAEVQRQLHRQLNTHLIVADYTDPLLRKYFTGEKPAE